MVIETLKIVNNRGQPLPFEIREAVTPTSIRRRNPAETRREAPTNPVARDRVRRPAREVPLPFVFRIAFSWFGGHQGVGPSRDDLGDLRLFPSVHVVGVRNHDRLHATRTTREMLGTGLEQ